MGQSLGAGWPPRGGDLRPYPGEGASDWSGGGVGDPCLGEGEGTREILGLVVLVQIYNHERMQIINK